MSTLAAHLPFNPFASNAVGDPWRARDVPDVRSINQPAFDGIVNLLGQIDRTDELAAMVLGEAGSGKTHLIKRLLSDRDLNIIFVYVRPIHDHRRMFSRLMETVAANLDGPPPGFAEDYQWTQLDWLVAHILRAAVEKLAETPGKVSAAALKKMADDALASLKFKQTPHWKAVVKSSEDFLTDLRIVHGKTSRRVIRALHKYVDKTNRGAVRTLLSGAALDDDECQTLDIDEFSEAELTTEAQEDRAKEILICLGRLLRFFRPMVLCFDQLENIDTDKLRRAFGRLANEIIDETENTFLIGFVRPGTWESELAPELDPMAKQRLSNHVFTLEGCTRTQKLELIRARLHWAFAGQPDNRPHDLYPFAPDKLDAVLRTGGNSPREVITVANRLLGESAPVEDPLEVLEQSFKDDRERILANPPKAPCANDAIIEALRVFFLNRGVGSAYEIRAIRTRETHDVSFTVVPKDKAIPAREVAIDIQGDVHWKPIQRNILDLTAHARSAAGAVSVFVRDARCPIPPKPNAMKKTVEKLELYRKGGGHEIMLDLPQIANLQALAFSADKIKPGDLTYTSQTDGHREAVDQATFERFVRERFHSPFTEEIESLFTAAKKPSPKPPGGKSVAGKKKRKRARREEEVVEAIKMTLDTPPFMFRLAELANHVRTRHGLEHDEDTLAMIIGRHVEQITVIDSAPPIYMLRK